MKSPPPNHAPVPFSHEPQLDVNEWSPRDVVEPTPPPRLGLFAESETSVIAHPRNEGPPGRVFASDQNSATHATSSDNDDASFDPQSRADIKKRDYDDRLLRRQRQRERRRQRTAERRAFEQSAKRHRSTRRARSVDAHQHRHARRTAALSDERSVSEQRRQHRDEGVVPTRPQLAKRRRDRTVAVATRRVTLVGSGSLQGVALAVYFVLLPYVVVTKWRYAPQTPHEVLIRGALFVLALFWGAFIVQLIRDIRRVARGDRSRRGGSAWLAGLLVALVPFFLSSDAGALTAPVPVSVHYEPAPGEHIAHFATPKAPLASLGALAPLGLMTRKKQTSVRSNQFVELDAEILTRVELLRSDPQVLGVLEPFTPTLRRRCIEMVAYLALHRHEPVTGERLRTRVLTHADVDASLRTLANTASAVRRSLGSDDRGPRLHSVTSSGLYETHGVTSDVEIFSRLVSDARSRSVRDGAVVARQALGLVQGEPMASALRGYEWFLSEGHGAALARDGEWAALVVHHDALESGNFELAFWALRQGLLIDPYSDVLLSTINTVPRLREFGSDRGGRTQHQAISASSAVAMSWTLASFSNQVTQ